jgi:prepilin-type N-terminal cleavage/methylation domain-containing protein
MVRIVCRSREQHASRQSDAGFTLVELVVALTVLAIGIVGVIGVTNSSFRVAGGASARSKMVAAATREVESLRAIPYGELGADRDGDGKPDCGTVSVVNGRWSCYLAPTTPRTSDGITFHLERTIQDATDIDTTDTLPADKHKEVIVSITWTDSGVGREVTQRSFLYPGGIGLATAGSTTTVVSNCTPDNPSGLSVSQVLDMVNGAYTLQYTTALDVRWSMSSSGCPASNFVVKYRKLGTSTWNEVTRISTSKEYRVSGLTAATTYEFQVFAKGPSGRISSPGSSVATGITGTATLNGCLIGTITVTPPGISKKAAAESADLEVDAFVRMPVNGTCTNYDIVYKRRFTGSTHTLQMTFENGAYNVTIPKTGPWDVGPRFIDILERSSRTKVGSVLFTVCEKRVTECG